MLISDKAIFKTYTKFNLKIFKFFNILLSNLFMKVICEKFLT